jgi:hypothetical protein
MDPHAAGRRRRHERRRGGVMRLVIESRPSTGPIDTPWGARLRQIEERIQDNEATGIRERWESGRLLLQKREGKQLPKGLLDEAANVLSVSRSELSKRMQFAQTIRTEDELRKTLTKFPTWNLIITKALPKKKKKPEPKLRDSAGRIRALIAAARGVGMIDDDEIHALQTDDATIYALESAVDLIYQIIQCHEIRRGGCADCLGTDGTWRCRACREAAEYRAGHADQFWPDGTRRAGADAVAS